MTEKFSDPAMNLDASEFEVNSSIISDFVIRKLVPAVGIKPFPLDELSLMTAAVCYFKPSFIFEWGTNVGKSALAFIEIIDGFDLKCHVHSIDLPDGVFHSEHPKHTRGNLVRGRSGVTLHQGDGMACSLEIIEKQKLENVLFFVDGDHMYDSVRSELETILAKVPNAPVLLHDTFYQAKSNYYVGPFNAINDVLKTRPMAYRRINTQLGAPGMTLIYPVK